MLFSFHKNCLRKFAPVFLALAVLPFWTGSVSAATYQIDFSGGASTVLGTFNAPITGGAVTNFSITLSGVTFDTSTGAATTFTYDPLVNEFSYTGGFASFTNSANNALCAIGACFLEIYPNLNPAVPGDYLAIDANLNNIDAGTKYIINPNPIAAVPIPATLPMALLGLVALMLAGKRWRSDGRPEIA